ncbi:hypothetical protein [Nocardia huaxiensis]|uniref:Uncharacterized protein n=1 Tax=Nocardia huaxiensis TaxID=2755382 RepID=A0A7D6VGT7_9NOCA|nr:hypothetical protein [Nocardia huaxiensis]QLY29330.1 hypothetical protein H0264_29240 [Nocardia huaxiensis]UFS97193.1 hypothetical protein LPY97_04490 [Nocardia huaxiensis]
MPMNNAHKSAFESAMKNASDRQHERFQRQMDENRRARNRAKQQRRAAGPVPTGSARGDADGYGRMPDRSYSSGAQSIPSFSDGGFRLGRLVAWVMVLAALGIAAVVVYSMVFAPTANPPSWVCDFAAEASFTISSCQR